MIKNKLIVSFFMVLTLSVYGSGSDRKTVGSQKKITIINQDDSDFSDYDTDDEELITLIPFAVNSQKESIARTRAQDEMDLDLSNFSLNTKEQDACKKNAQQPCAKFSPIARPESSAVTTDKASSDSLISRSSGTPSILSGHESSPQFQAGVGFDGIMEELIEQKPATLLDYGFSRENKQSNLQVIIPTLKRGRSSESSLSSTRSGSFDMSDQDSFSDQEDNVSNKCFVPVFKKSRK